MFYIYANGKMIYHLANPELYLNQPKLTLEMGKAGSLEFGIMPDHAFYDQLSQLTTIVTVDYDETEIFRGRVLSNTRDFQNMRQVYCEGDLSYLVDTVQRFDKYNGTVHDLFRKIITGHNTRIKDASKQFTVGNITVENRSVKLTGQSDEVNVGQIDYKQIALNSIVDEWNTTYDLIQTCIIDYVGGYLNTRRQNGVTYIDLLAAPSNTNENSTTQEIELGVNMLDLEEEVSGEDLFTVLIPLGDDNLTIKSVNNGSDELVDTAAVAKYGRIVKTHVFSNVNEASTLKENGQRLLASSINIPTTLTVNALDKHIVNKSYDPIHLCDRVRIKSTRHNLVEYLTCTKIEYDLENPGNDTYTFGNPTQTLTQRYREDKRKESDTYGNSASGGHGGGGGAAADAAEAAGAAGEEDVDNKLNNFYTSYIDLDPSDGNISLHSAYERILKMKNVLSEWGIDAFADDTSSAININTLYEQTGIIGAQVQTNSTSIQQVSDASHAEISLVAASVNTLGGVVDENTSNIASLTLTANNQGQSIATLSADVINLDGEIQNIKAKYITADNLKAKISEISYLDVNYLDGTYVSALNGMSIGDIEVYHKDHYHSLTASSDGTVRMGTATYSSTNASFNIADTNFYKNGVSAAKQSVRVKDIRKNPDSNITYGSSTKTIYYPVQANTTEYETYHHNVVLNVPGDDAYNAGVSSVTISSIELNGSATYQTANKRYSVPVKATASNGNYSPNTLYVNATDAFNAGVNTFEAVSVTVLGDAVYRYTSDGSSSGTNVGSSVSTTYLYVSWDGVNFSKWNPSQGVYYAGSSYSHSLRGGGGYYYNSGGSKTYYRKK